MANGTQRIGNQDQFVSEPGLQWATQNRRTAIIAAVSLVLLLIVVAVSYSVFQHRSNQAASAFGAAMETYQTPLVHAGQPVPPGMKTFNTAEERAKAANGQFLDVANRFGMTKPGKLARYFAGVTYMEEGQNSSAEDTLKTVAGSWDHDVAALGKMALAQLYQQTGRDAQAADVYNELSKGKASTVPPGLAQLQLGEMYSAAGDQAKAREIWAKLKDSDKDAKGNPGPAATLATEKLNPTPTGPGPR